MAKFLRFIFNLLLMLYIVAALALFVPPLVGVSTAVTKEATEGNQELASVNYAWRIPLKELQTGDEILVTDDSSVNVYSVASVDVEEKTVTAADADQTEVKVRSSVYKLVLTVPYLGYIAILMDTQEGMIILGAVAGTLLVLCILTSVWVRRRKIKRMKEDEENQIDEEDNQFFETLASQKRESDQRAEAAFYEQREALKETVVIDPKTLSLDEEYEELPPADTTPVSQESEELLEAFDEEDAQNDVEAVDSGVADADDLLSESKADENAAQEKREETASAEGMTVERAVSTGNIPGVQAALEAALNTQQIQRHVRRAEVIREPEVEPEALPADEIELAMPVYTADEYLQKAYQAGKDPVVKKDELTGVTYIDYSECL